MEGTEINKIILISFCDNWTSSVANLLSQCLGMMFCDVNDLVEYELVDKEALEKATSKEYLQKNERKVMKHVASFENVVVAISYDYYIHNVNVLREKALTVFLKVPKNFIEKCDIISEIAYYDRCENIKKETDVNINIVKTDEQFVCDKIIKTLRGVL